MNKNFNSKKFFILLTVVCVVFVVAIINAFMYLPTDDNQILKVGNADVNMNYSDKTQSEDDSEDNTTSEEQSSNKKGKIVVNDDLEEIDAPPGVNEGAVNIEGTEAAKANAEAGDSKAEVELSPEQKAEAALIAGNKYRNDKQYVKALEEYQKVYNITQNKDLVASSYEGIATVYASNKRYGTALSFATKAYNMSPSSNREMLLARLFYKTGEVDKATQRVNNVLKREFSADRW